MLASIACSSICCGIVSRSRAKEVKERAVTLFSRILPFNYTYLPPVNAPRARADSRNKNAHHRK